MFYSLSGIILANCKLKYDIIISLMVEIKAKKKFGQNFLKDESILFKIIEAMPNSNNHIVEIGPGLGDLTSKIVKCKDVTAYEVDRDLFSILQSKFANELKSKRLELVLGDVLDTWRMKKTLYDAKYDLIANLPYYIATNIILKAFEDSNCDSIMVMVQKEVAEKFTANVGEKKFSSLAVITKLISDEVRILFDVSPSSFEPPPKVNSSILYIKKNKDKKIDFNFNKFLKSAFSQPRKKLFRNLSNIVDKAILSIAYQELDIDDNTRPHEISPSLYCQLYKKVILNNGRKKATRKREYTNKEQG